MVLPHPQSLQGGVLSPLQGCSSSVKQPSSPSPLSETVADCQLKMLFFAREGGGRERGRGGELNNIGIERKTLELRRNQTTNSIHMCYLARIEPWPLLAMAGRERSHDYAISAPAGMCLLY